jgi:hypothetical protein
MFKSQGNTCRDFVDGHYLTEEDFFMWNPALNGNCDGLWADYYYCVVGPGGITAMPPTVTIPPASIPYGQTEQCQRWYQRGGESCQELVVMFSTFSLNDFLGWNPSIGSECANIADGQWYCVGIPGTPTTRTAPIPTTEPPVPTSTGA